MVSFIPIVSKGMIVSGNQSLVQQFSQSDISYLIYDWNHKTHIYIYSACLYSSQLPLCENNIPPKLLVGRWRDAPLKVTMAGRPLALVMLRPRSATWAANGFWWGTLRSTWGCVNDFVRLYMVICCYILTMSYYCRYDYFGVLHDIIIYDHFGVPPHYLWCSKQESPAGSHL